MACFCSLVPSPFDEAQSDAAPSKNLRDLCAPTLYGRSYDYLLSILSASYPWTVICPDRCHRRLLVYIDDFSAAACLSSWV